MILKTFKYNPTRHVARPHDPTRHAGPLPFAGPAPIRANAVPRDQTINILPTKPRRQNITILPGGKRRIQPSLVQSLGATGTFGSQDAAGPSESQSAREARLEQTARAFADAAEQPLESQSRIADARDAIIQGVDDAFDDLPLAVGKRRASEDVSPDKRATKGRTLGGDRPKESRPITEIRAAMVDVQMTGGTGSGRILSVPAVQNMIRSISEENNKMCVEATNNTTTGKRRATGFACLADGACPGLYEISMLKDGDVQWLDYSRAPFIGLAITPTLTCATSEDADLVIYSNNGVKLLAPIRLDSPASFVHAVKHFVLVITCKGTMNAWYVLSLICHNDY